MLGEPPSRDEPPVTPDELAREIYTLANGSKAWDELAPPARRELAWQASRIQDRLADRRLTDPQRRAISRIESAGDRAADDVAAAIEDARGLIGGGEEAIADARRDGITLVLDELARLDLTDEIAGADALDDLARRLRRETR